MVRVLARLARVACVIAAAALAAATLVAGVARISDGPIHAFPGGRLVAGKPTPFGAVDWRALNRVREIEFQLETPRRSRITRMTVHEGVPYIPCAFCENEFLKRWPRELEIDDRVVLRVEGMLIEGRALRIPNGSEEYIAARGAHLEKFAPHASTRSAVESGAAGIVVAAGEALPGGEGPRKADSWMYRIDPR